MNEKFYKFIIQNASIGYAYHKIIYNEKNIPIDYEFIEVNEVFEKLTGLEKKYIIGKRITKIMGNIVEDELDWIKIFNTLLKNGYTEDMEVKLNTKTGEEIEGLFSSEVIKIKTERYILNIIRDITEQKKIERELLRQSQLQSILMNISTKYINLPLEELDSAINASLKEMGEFTLADRAYIFDYDFRNNTTSNTYEWCNEGISPQMKALQNISLEHIPIWVDAHKKGRMMHISNVSALDKKDLSREILELQEIKSLLTIPLMLNDVCIGFLGFDSVLEHHNYTQKEIKLLTLYAQMLVNVRNRMIQEKKLTQSKLQAEAANIAKSQFLTNISHEIRTPINGIVGFLQLLEIEETNEEKLEYIKNIKKSMDVFQDVINNILDVSKIEAGKIKIERILFDLNATIESAVMPFIVKANEKNIKMNIEIEKEVPRYVIGDPRRLRQIITNLISNAVKFTEQGNIFLSVEWKEGKYKKREMVFTVKDTGIGMPKEVIQNLFNPFFQVDSSLTRKYEGTGLGLAICKSIVELMNGSIQVNSEEGKGSEFSFNITLDVPQNDGQET